MSYGDNTVLDSSQHPEDIQPILRKEVKVTVAALKKGKSAGVDNIPALLVQAGEVSMINGLTKIWKTGEWPNGLGRLLLHYLIKATYSSVRTTEPSASSVIRVQSC